MQELTICGSGHRPNKLGTAKHSGYSPVIEDAMVHTLRKARRQLREDHGIHIGRLISGMALGWDTAIARFAVEEGLLWTAAVPFKGQEKMWPQASQTRYHDLLSQADEVVVVSEGGYSPAKMQVRNIWMADHSQFALVLHDGTPGGTGNFVKYVQDEKKPWLNVWDLFEDARKGL